MRVRCLSIRQPWAWLIVRPDITDPQARAWAARERLMKDIENRGWPTKLRGGFLVHAAKGMTTAEYASALSCARMIWMGWALRNEQPLPEHATGACAMPPAADLARGGIVGYAELVDVIGSERAQDMGAKRSPWFMGEYGFQLANVTPLPFVPLTGSLGFFQAEVPDDYIPAPLRARLMR